MWIVSLALRRPYTFIVLALAARLVALDIQVRRITASVLLVKALGGDFAASGSARRAAAP
jgi:hypothetical protein